MRVTCPGCEAVYDVPDAMAGSGRKLRCARCGEAWQPAVPADAVPHRGATAATAATHAPADAPADASTGAPMSAGAGAVTDPLLPPRPPGSPAAPSRPRTSPAIWAALAVSVLLLVGGAAALLLWPEPVAATWPPITRLYAALGVH